MAGNIVKWWKHKILGGYKQFSVQECTTDSEELMYHQVRASSSCSAPPDLLLVSERDNNIQLRSPVVNIITTPPGNASSSAAQAKQQQQQHPQQALPLHHHHQQQHHHVTRQQDINSSGSHSKHLRISSSSGRHNKYANMPQQQQQQDEDVVDAAVATPHAAGHGQHSRHLHHHNNKEERIRLEEFTCDVSVEGGKSSQPLQFSFTFYDLDGHHGKITKDDIVGIVYTIYESIGKSVVVPHCGSKTINVRLTVSPEGKSKSQAAAAAASAAATATATATANTCINNSNSNSHSNNNSSSTSKLKKLPTGMAAAMSKAQAHHGGGVALATSGGARRQHRHRPRKLIKSDDEDDDSNSDKEKEIAATQGTEQQPSGRPSKSSRYQKNNTKLEQCCSGQQQQQQQLAADQHTPDNGHNTYENMLNLKCCSNKDSVGGVDMPDCAAQRQRQHHHSQDVYMKQATQRVKMLRRARKQKYQDHCLETRQRSLSVGNDSSWQHRHLQQQQQSQQQQSQLASPISNTHGLAQKSSSSSPPLGDVMLDGVQLRQPRPQSLLGQQQRKSAECWKSALNRNDLISIIRESMEKNRLCFQLNGKPQANVSPIRQPAAQQQQQQQREQRERQRCNTGSKIPTLIANHNSPQSAGQSPLSCSPPTHSPLPIINIEAGHDTMGSNSNSSPYHPQPHIPIYHQQLAINPAVVAAQHSHNSAHNKLNLCGYDSFLHATICGGGAAHSPPATPSNVATVQPIPKKSSASHHTKQGQGQAQTQPGQGQGQGQLHRSSKDYKNYGNLIYAKLSEQLQQKEREQRRQRHKQQQQMQQQQQQHQQEQQKQTMTTLEARPPTSSSSGSAGSKIYGDALECAHLLASEDETELAPSPLLTSTPCKVVSTDTLIDLNDDVGEAVAEAVTAKDTEELSAPATAEADLDTSASSSMIHRYVHEHIHHHYHHFKEQNDV